MNAATPSKNPEIGKSVRANGIQTNYHDVGSGSPVLMIHGSGPGVSAWANWRLTLPSLSQRRRLILPDMVGFGYTERPAGIQYGLDTWVAHAIGLLDALDLKQVDLIGNSFGGGLSLAIAARHPKRVRRLVLMGSAGVDFELTPALDEVWAYTPSFDKMRHMMDLFAYDRSLVTDDLARMRYEASLQPGLQEAYASMFPAPRQRCVEALCTPVSDLRHLPHETLIIHGREDKVVPPVTARKLNTYIANSQMHIFGKCGHWTQIEQSARFCRLVNDFLDEADAA